MILQFRHEPVCLILSRQNMPTLDRTRYGPASGLAKGAYILATAAGDKLDVILIGTGSEVSLCVDAYEKLTRAGTRVVRVEQGGGLPKRCGFGSARKPEPSRVD